MNWNPLSILDTDLINLLIALTVGFIAVLAYLTFRATNQMMEQFEAAQATQEPGAEHGSVNPHHREAVEEIQDKIDDYAELSGNGKNSDTGLSCLDRLFTDCEPKVPEEEFDWGPRKP